MKNEAPGNLAVAKFKFEYYRDSAHEWRWTLIWRNGKKRADSAEGYKRKSACLKDIDDICAVILLGQFEIVERPQMAAKKAKASK